MSRDSVRRAWRYQPDSFQRGYVMGSMFSGLACSVVLLVLMLITSITVIWPVIVLMAATGALGTFMWFHG